MHSMTLSVTRPSRFLAVVLGIALLTACESFRAPLPPKPRAPAPSAPAPTKPPAEEPAPQAPPPPSQPQRQFRLSAASGALVTQAQKQAKGGDSVAATATLERALRIEPDNPLLWIELGRLRLQEKNASQAQSLGRKALALATGDPRAQSSAWHLIADALRAQGRNTEAREAEQRADAAVTPLSSENDDASSSFGWSEFLAPFVDEGAGVWPSEEDAEPPAEDRDEPRSELDRQFGSIEV